MIELLLAAGLTWFGTWLGNWVTDQYEREEMRRRDDQNLS